MHRALGHALASKQAADAVATVCLPLMAYGEVLGLLHVQTAAADSGEGARRLAKTVGTHISLSLSTPSSGRSCENSPSRTTSQASSTGATWKKHWHGGWHERKERRRLWSSSWQAWTISSASATRTAIRPVTPSFGPSAQAMQRQIRASDLACRFGGEPFALLVPDARKRPGNPGRYRSVLSHSG